MIKAPMKIFLADDDADDRLFFVDALSEISVLTDVTLFEDGSELMNYLNGESPVLPSLLFLDLNMPRKSGLECLLEIRQNPILRRLSVAIYSTSASEQDIEKTFVQGANVYIRKPNNYGALKKVLSEVLKVSWHYETSSLNRENFLMSI